MSTTLIDSITAKIWGEVSKDFAPAETDLEQLNHDMLRADIREGVETVVGRATSRGTAILTEVNELWADKITGSFMYALDQGVNEFGLHELKAQVVKNGSQEWIVIVYKGSK